MSCGPSHLFYFYSAIFEFLNLALASLPVIIRPLSISPLICVFINNQTHQSRLSFRSWWNLSTTYCSSLYSYEAQLADIFTKALGQSQFHSLLCKLGVSNLQAQTWEGCWEYWEYHTHGMSLIVYIVLSFVYIVRILYKVLCYYW